jgi:ankyrin repeat protein
MPSLRTFGLHSVAAVICLCSVVSAAAAANPKLDAALCDAAPTGAPKAITALIKKGANPNTVCSAFEATPLENAARVDNAANMTALLAAGADVNAWSGGDACCWKTALGFSYSAPTMRFLVAHHADVNVRSPGQGDTPLLWMGESVTMDNSDQTGDADAQIAQVLVDAGADVNAQDTMGMTPLLMGVSAHGKSFVTLLLDHGANVNARNSSGNDALDVVLNGENSPLTSAADVQSLKDVETLLRARGGVQ